MKVQFEATPQQLKKIAQLLRTDECLSDIISQLNTAAALNDDSQSGEIPAEGDNSTIKRME
jgi:hypothetical protein